MATHCSWGHTHSFCAQDLNHVGPRRPAPGNHGGRGRHDNARHWDRDQLPEGKDVLEDGGSDVATQVAELVEERPVKRDPCRYRDQTTLQRQEAG